MTGDDILKAVFGLVLVLMGGSISWLVSSVLTARERLIELAGRLTKVEADAVVSTSTQVTVECVREVIESALDKRDKVYAERRVEWDKLRKLEIQEAVHEEIEKAIPRIVREVNGTKK